MTSAMGQARRIAAVAAVALLLGGLVAAPAAARPRNADAAPKVRSGSEDGPPDRESARGIKEKVHLPIYDSQ
jgi:hypothetical protein